MTQEEIEGNKIIAEFIGGISTKETFWAPAYYKLSFDSSQLYTVHMLCFHSDWNWLMSVVEKIRSIEDKDDGFSVLIGAYKTWINTFEYSGKSLIEATFKAVVAFITWYNENKK